MVKIKFPLETERCGFSVDEIEVYLVRVLTGDSSSYDMPSWTWHAVWSLKVNDGVTPWSFSVKQTDVLDSVKGDAHSNLQEMKHDMICSYCPRCTRNQIFTVVYLFF